MTGDYVVDINNILDSTAFKILCAILVIMAGFGLTIPNVYNFLSSLYFTAGTPWEIALFGIANLTFSLAILLKK